MYIKQQAMSSQIRNRETESIDLHNIFKSILLYLHIILATITLIIFIVKTNQISGDEIAIPVQR